MKTTLIAAAILLILTRAWAGQPSPTPPNWGQADVSDWTCPLSPQAGPPNFVALPASVALTTGQGAVLVSLTLNSFTVSSPLGQLLADFTLDGAPVGALVDWNDRTGAGGHLSTMTRILPVTSGTHRVGVTIACVTFGEAMVIERAWLSAYELPTLSK